MKHPRITLTELLAKTATRSGRKAAMIFSGTRISYSTLLDQAERLAAGLQALGLRRGERVALLMQNCPQFLIAYFGILRAGGVVTATSPIYTSREACHQWIDAGARVVIADRSLAATVHGALPACPALEFVVWSDVQTYRSRSYPKLLRLLRTQSKLAPKADGSLEWIDLLRTGRKPTPARTRPADVACLQYTGGTTGISKGAMLTHHNLVSNAQQTCGWLTEGRNLAETFVGALPLFHIYATTCVMISSIRCAGTVILLPRFELQAVLGVVKKYRPTIFHGVPTMYVAFNNAPNIRSYGFKSLRICMSGGAPLPLQVRETFEALSGGKLLEGYGLTEASPVTHINPTSGARAGSIGVLIPGTQARIVDLEQGERDVPEGEAGELLIRGPQVMKGYWNKPQETALVLRDGWLHTGDVAKRDAEGFYYIVDRKKDLIIAGGYNVYPREVEEVLFEHPSVQEAVVIGMPCPYRGETVKAFVVTKPETPVTQEELVAFCRERLASYKVPRMVEFRDSLPKSGVGKYLRRELRNGA